MITVSNYATERKKITVPKELLELDAFTAENADLYNDDQDIKRTIDLYLEKLNREVHAESEKKIKPAKEIKNYDKENPNYYDIEANVKRNFNGTYSYRFIRSNNYSGGYKTKAKAIEAAKKHKAEAIEYIAAKESKVTPENCQILDKSGKPRIDAEALDTLESCSESLPQTKDKHFKDGKYTPERQKLHDKLLEGFKKDKPCVKQREPMAILTGGAPGSGKTHWLKKHADWITGNKVYHIDADEVRAKLPEYKGWNATSTHQETKDIVNAMIDSIGEPCEHDLVYDGTMNKATSYEPLIAKLRKYGYKIFIIYISVPKEVSQQRVLERYRKHGRYVPRVVINEVYERGLDAFEKLAKEADGYIHIDGVTGKTIDKGGMALPTKARYEDDCNGNCDETEEQLKKRIYNEQFPQGTPKVSKGATQEQVIERVGKILNKLDEEKVLKIGRHFQKTYRVQRYADADAHRDSKKRLSPTPENLIRWMKHPGQFDLIGVDTFKATDATADYKRIISKQKVFALYGIKI